MWRLPRWRTIGSREPTRTYRHDCHLMHQTTSPQTTSTHTRSTQTTSSRTARTDTALEWGGHDTVEISLLGGFPATLAGHQTPGRAWPPRGPGALFKILGLAPGHRRHREKMMDLLCRDESPERSAPRL